MVDHILHDSFTQHNIFEVLAEYPVLLVGVHCPAEELERRETARGDRQIGLGRKQLDFMHRREIYDVEVNTFAESAGACADRIIACLGASNFPDGWLRTQASD